MFEKDEVRGSKYKKSGKVINTKGLSWIWKVGLGYHKQGGAGNKESMCIFHAPNIYKTNSEFQPKG